MRIDYIKLLKLSIGCCAAVLIANLLGLRNSTSAGIITLLSIQETKKETLLVAARRTTAFFPALAIALCTFLTAGFTVSSFGIFLLLFILFCHGLRLQEGITMNTVLVSHLWSARTVEPSLVLNEFYLLLIGVGIGVIANSYMPVMTRKIREEQGKIDGSIKKLLFDMAEHLQSKKSFSLEEDFTQLESHMKKARRQAQLGRDNSLTCDLRYYVDYVELRMAQCRILRRMATHLKTPRPASAQAALVAGLLRETAGSLHEYNNAQGILLRWQEVYAQFSAGELPATREAFAEQAALYQLLGDLEYFILLKKQFAERLSQTQKKKFWTI